MRGPYSTPITPLTGSLFHADPQLAAVLGPLYASGALRSGLVNPDLPLSPGDADKAICDLLSAVEAAIGIDSEADR